MSISDLFVTGYTAKKNTESTGSDFQEVTNTLSTDTDIGTAGVFSACQRQLTGRERDQYGRPSNWRIERFYTEATGLTMKHWILDPNGELWNIVNINNPHDRDEFFQIDGERKMFEKENE